MSTYLREHVLSRRNNFDKEYKIVDIRTRKEKWVHGLGNIKLDENDNVIELFGTIQEITDRKLAELALLASQELYAVMQSDLIEKGYWNGEIWNRRKNGHVYPAALTKAMESRVPCPLPIFLNGSTPGNPTQPG